MSSEAVRVEDIVPDVLDVKSFDAAADGGDTLEYDLGNLLVHDAATVGTTGDAADVTEAELTAMATARVQLLLNRIWVLPVEKTSEGPVVKLPTGVARLPRCKPVPVKRPETTWEKFAKARGIKNRKRDRLVYDEEDGDWKRAYGYGRANDEERFGVELGPNDDPSVDYLEERKLKKQQRVVQNKMNHLKNLERAAKVGPAGGIAVEYRPAPTNAPLVKGQKAAAKKAAAKEQTQPRAVKAAKLAMAQVSTASLGKFDRAIAGEPVVPRKSKHRTRIANEDTEKERTRNAGLLRRVLGHADTMAAASQELREREQHNMELAGDAGYRQKGLSKKQAKIAAKKAAGHKKSNRKPKMKAVKPAIRSSQKGV